MLRKPRRVEKGFFSNKVLDSVDFDVQQGEVHATLVGENGAGKSTLINIIGGIFQQDPGAIVFDGKEVNFTHPLEAMGRGSASFSSGTQSRSQRHCLAENIFLRREKRNAFGLNTTGAL